MNKNRKITNELMVALIKYHVLNMRDDEEMNKYIVSELEKKLNEEYQEVLEANGSERVEELADMLEVIKALGELEHTTLEEIINIANTKSIKRGAFKDKIFLEKVIDNK